MQYNYYILSCCIVFFLQYLGMLHSLFIEHILCLCYVIISYHFISYHIILHFTKHIIGVHNVFYYFTLHNIICSYIILLIFDGLLVS